MEISRLLIFFSVLQYLDYLLYIMKKSFGLLYAHFLSYSKYNLHYLAWITVNGIFSSSDSSLN